jgi:TonB-dependent starch-binding outer membrane protein SusC
MKYTHQARQIIIALVLALPVVLPAQIIVKGKVISSVDKQPMIGAVVAEKNTSNGTTTNLDGEYSIKVKDGNAVLVVSYIGYKTIETIVAKRNQIDFELQDQAFDLDEVVAIGYGVVRKSDITGSLSTIKSKDIDDAKAGTIDQLLAGRAAGVQVTSNSGEPGAGMTIRVRGASSINAEVEPLYVIDGIPIEKGETLSSAFSGMGKNVSDPLSSINPNDIKSVEILKDASATAIYGSKGANGVVLITTKSGTEGKPKVSFSTTIGANLKPQNTIKMMNGAQFAEFMSLTVPTDMRYTDPTGLPRNYTDSVSYNWQDELMRTSMQQTYSLTVSGGTKNNTYAASIGHLSNEGVIKSSYERTNFRVNFRSEISEKLIFNASLLAAKSDQSGTVTGGSGSGASAGVVQQMLVFRPVNVGSLEEIDLETLSSNPVQYLNNYVRNNKRYETNYNFSLQYNISKALNFRTMYGGNFNHVRTKEFIPSTIAAGFNVGGRNTSAYGLQSKWLWENTLNYSKRIKQTHSINAMLGYILEKADSRSEVTQVENISDQTLGEESIEFGMNFRPVTNLYALRSSISYLGRINYSYKNRYLITGSLRADGSSKFTENNKFSYFPSGAFAWRVSEEDFLKRNNSVTDLKLRISYGTSGNQGIQSYSTLNQMGAARYSFDNVTVSNGVSQRKLGNEKLKWETTNQYNAGIDLTLFKGRLGFVFDVYDKYTSDLLLNQRVTYGTGSEFVMANVGSVQNKGIELTINTLNIRNKNFTWETSFNISANRNKVLDLGSVESFFADPGNGNVAVNSFIIKKGEAIGTMWGYQYTGVYQYSDFVNFYNVDPVSGRMTLKPIEESAQIYAANRKTLTLMPGVVQRAGITPEPGNAKYKDITGDGIVNEFDKGVIGRSEPVCFGGMTNTFNYKGLFLSFFLRYSIGNNIFNGSFAEMTMSNTNRSKTEKLWLNAWKPLSESNGYPYMYDTDGNQKIPSTLMVEDGSYIKLSDISVGYNLPSKVCSRLGVKDIGVSVSAKNLYTLTKYSGYDPEISNSDPLSIGWDRFNYPQSRTVLATLNVSF